MNNLNVIDKRYLEINYIIKQIDDWYKKNEDKILTIITTPYNTCSIFKNIIDTLSRKGQKVLYVITGDFIESEIIKKIFFYRSSLRVDFKNDYKEMLKFIDFVSANNIHELNSEYDLVIYDDISYFSQKSQIQAKLDLDYLYKKNKKLLVYSIETMLKNSKTLEMCDCLEKTPFIEPRVITTRIDLTKDIPYLMYDYLKWFKKNNRKVIIHTPSKEMVDMVYGYFIKTLKISFRIRILKAKDKKQYKMLKSLHELKDKPLMIITDYIGDYLNMSNNIDIVIYFADDKFFNYKKLVYLCGKVVMSSNGQGEVLLVSKGISKDMDKVKDIARNFNKNLWEKGLLSF